MVCDFGLGLVRVYDRLQEQVESGKMKVQRIVVDIDSQYDADDIARAIYYAIHVLIDSWLRKTGHTSDAVNARPVQVRVCVRGKCENTEILVDVNFSDHEIEKLVSALAKLINLLAPSLRLTEQEAIA